MIPINSNNRTLELYSIRRNRNLYPNPSSFEVNFSPTNHCYKIPNDPVCNGAIYYKFDWFPQIEKLDTDISELVSYDVGIFGEGTTQDFPVLDILYSDDSPNNIFFEENLKDFFVGFKVYNIKDNKLGQYRVITSWDPSTNRVTLNRPFIEKLEVGGSFFIYSILPQEWNIYIPTIDSNKILVNKTPLYYNGYYVVFESPNPNYSNSTNSNIFSRRISYYDSETQLAYFDEPLPFSYTDNVPNFNQIWTLRKDLPLERWSLNKTTYYKTTRSDNLLIGPLPGYVVILPDEASSIDNYYKGKYIYVVSNAAEVYSPPLPPQNKIKAIKNSFYPIYGLFYIRAYNGTTKECSIENVDNKIVLSSYNITNSSDIPTYILTNINASNLMAFANCEIIDEGGGVYKIDPIPSIQPYPGTNEYCIDLKLNLKKSKTYRITLSVRQSNTIEENYSYFIVFRGTSLFYSNNANPAISTDYQIYTFDITVGADNDNLIFVFIFKTDDIPNAYFEINFLEVIQFDTINIVDLKYDNYSPLDYNGTMVSTNNTVCYEMMLSSITLPNRKLLTGSVIAFYSFIYVQIENATAPNKASNNIIISNNPPSNKAVFTVYVPQVNDPENQAFVTLIGDNKQIIKFKPNDNLKFSIYLPDGKPFQTLLPDNLSPYEPDPSLQIHLVLSLTRISESS